MVVIVEVEKGCTLLGEAVVADSHTAAAAAVVLVVVVLVLVLVLVVVVALSRSSSVDHRSSCRHNSKKKNCFPNYLD